jgi:membrane protein
LTHYFFAVGGGVAGTIFILLVWVFYSAQIIFLGAKITKVYADMLNMPIVPRKKFIIPNG